MAKSLSRGKYQGERKMIPSKKIFEKTPEAEIEELKKRIKKLEAKIEKERAPEEKEKAVKKEIRSYLEELESTPPFAAPTVTRDEAREIERFSEAEQVGALISLVFEKGLSHAVSVARNLKNPAVLDEFHDTLVDSFYNTLLEKGVLKKI